MPKYVLSQFPTTSPATVMATLNHALQGAPAGLERRIRIGLTSDGNARLEVLTNHTRLGSAVDAKLEGHLYEAYNAHPVIAAGNSRMPRDMVETLVDEVEFNGLFESILKLFALAIADENGARLGSGLAAGTALCTPVEHCLYVLGEDTEPSAAAFARIEWRATGMAVGAVVAEAGQSPAVKTLARIGIDPGWGATQDLAMRHQMLYEKQVDLRLAYEWPLGAVLLKTDVVMSANLRDIAASLLMQVAGRVSREMAPAVLAIAWDGAGEQAATIDIFSAPLPQAIVIPAVSTVGDTAHSRSIEVNLVQFRQSASATVELRELMERNASDIGYRLQLSRLPQYAESADDLDEIQRQIEELQIRRDVLNGEAAGDWRLLRFTADQLDAMVDYIRRFSLETIDAGHVQYAFHASTSDVRGVHFLLYRLRDVGMEPPYPEAYWRAQSDSGTIVHRVDALFAQFATTRGARSLVFTPPNFVVVPNFRATQQDIDTYLRQGFGGLLGLEDAFASLGSQPDLLRPVYSFGRSGSGDIRIEILDAAGFQPIGRVVPFLNDNLELARRVDIADFITNAARGEWRQQRLDQLDSAGRDMEKQLGDRMEQIDRSLAAQSEQVITALTGEIDAVRARLASLLQLVDDLTGRSVAIEKIVADAIKDAGNLEAAADAIPSRFAELQQTRSRVNDAIAKEHETSRSFAATASQRLNDMRADIDRLERALRNE